MRLYLLYFTLSLLFVCFTFGGYIKIYITKLLNKITVFATTHKFSSERQKLKRKERRKESKKKGNNERKRDRKKESRKERKKEEIDKGIPILQC